MASGEPFEQWHKDQLVAAVRTGKSPRSATVELGYTWRTVKAHLESDHEFRAALVDARHDATAVIEDQLYREAKGGNLGAIKFWLTNQGEGWTDERDHGPKQGGAAVQVGTVNIIGALREGFTDEEIRGDFIEAIAQLGTGSAGALGEGGDAGAPGADGHR